MQSLNIRSIYSSLEQDKQCKYNMTLRGVHATIVALEKQSVLYIPSVYL